MVTVAPTTSEVAESSKQPVTRFERFCLAGSALLLLYFAFYVFAFVQDDAFITYRYAWHMRHGYGPVFNPGEHTEGYSCPLYMFLTAILMFVPGDVLFRAKILGLVCAIATLCAAWRLAREIGLPARVCGIVPLLLSANATFALSAVDGMETSLQALLVTLAALFFVREQRSGQGWRSACFLLAAALDRAEGAIYFVGALVPFVLGIRRHGLQRRDAVWLAVFLLPMALFLLWRHANYGYWLPNTYYAKNVTLESALDYAMGPSYILRTIFVNLNGRIYALIISILLWLVAVYGAVSATLRRNGAMLITLGALGQVMVALRAGGDWMVGWRYMVAATPLWTLLLAAGVRDIVAPIGESRLTKPRRLALTIGYGTLLTIFMVAGWEYRNIETTSTSWAAAGWSTDARKLMQPCLRIAERSIDLLTRLLPAGSTVAFHEMGVVPYYTPQLRWLDVFGLTDSEAAHLNTNSHSRIGILQDEMDATQDLGKLVLRRRPDYILRWTDHSAYVGPILHNVYVPMRRLSLGVIMHSQWQDLAIWKRRP